MDAVRTNAPFGGAGGRIGSAVAGIAGGVVHGLIAFVFAAVGTVLGAITGGMIGLGTESGLVRGTGVGAISGALVSMEIAESSVAMWRSDESAIWSVLYVLDVLWSLITGRLVQEKVNPAVRNAMESQMSAVDTAFSEEADIFEMAGGTNGMAVAAINRLPVTKFTKHSIVDSNGEQIGCSVCLQDFEAGERARWLPVCRHTFHLPCIDSWLLRHPSCPLCRRAI